MMHREIIDQDRISRRQRLARHLRESGPRPVLEALISVAGGQPLDDMLEGFARIPATTYRAQGTDELLVDMLGVIDGDAA